MPKYYKNRAKQSSTKSLKDKTIDLSSSSLSTPEKKKFRESKDMFNNHAASTSKSQVIHKTNPHDESSRFCENLDCEIASDVDKFLRQRQIQKSRLSRSNNYRHSSAQLKLPFNQFHDRTSKRSCNTDDYETNQVKDHVEKCESCQNRIQQCLQSSHAYPTKRRHSTNHRENKDNYSQTKIARPIQVSESRNSTREHHRHHCHDEFDDTSIGSSRTDEQVEESNPLCTIL